MEAAEALAASRDEALEFFAWAETWYHDLLMLALGHGTQDCVNLDMLPELRRRGAAPVEHILSVAANAARGATKIQRNLNRRMVLENFLFGVVGSG
jgi:hypothetical protein